VIRGSSFRKRRFPEIEIRQTNVTVDPTEQIAIDVSLIIRQRAHLFRLDDGWSGASQRLSFSNAVNRGAPRQYGS
jgi:hypothetical protein